MGKRRTLVLMLCLGMMSVLLSSQTASAGKPVPTLSELLQNEALSEESAQALVADSPNQPLVVSDYDQCPDASSLPPPDHTYTYHTFTAWNGTTASLNVDEFDPVGTGPWPVLMLFHGGGWWRGCRFDLQQVALDGAGKSTVLLDQYFIVLNFDYRLACDHQDPNLQSSSILILCEWRYPTPDPISIGPAVHDVQSAVTWVNNTWLHPITWNHKVAMLGTSAGGTLAYSALAPESAVGGAVTVDALAAWSGTLEFDQQNDAQYHHWPCDLKQTKDEVECGKSENNFMNCPTSTYPPQSSCSNYGRYTSGSPLTNYTSLSLPPNFFANGGGACNTSPCKDGGDNPAPELVSIQSMRDFKIHLDDSQWTRDLNYLDCTVNATAHGRALKGWPCNDGSSSVWWRTSEFLGRFVGS